jgi:hypothetical protein
MTPDQIKMIVDETDRRFRSRTPSKSVLDVAPSYRVTRPEMVGFARSSGFELPLPGTNDDYDRAIYELYDRLRIEFPDERWEKIGTFAADRARRMQLGMPQRSNSLKSKKKPAASLRHCSKCGKFSRNRTGEYVRKDGSAGYINQEERETGLVCSDCRDLEETNGE